MHAEEAEGDMPPTCVAGAQQQGLLDDVHADHCREREGPLQPHRALAHKARLRAVLLLRGRRLRRALLPLLFRCRR